MSSEHGWAVYSLTVEIKPLQKQPNRAIGGLRFSAKRIIPGRFVLEEPTDWMKAYEAVKEAVQREVATSLGIARRRVKVRIGSKQRALKSSPMGRGKDQALFLKGGIIHVRAIDPPAQLCSGVGRLLD